MSSLRIITGQLLTKDKNKIAYKHYSSGHSTVIIIAHGFFNSKDSRLLLELKDYLTGAYDVVMFDFRGHGESSGLFSWTSKEHFDLESVLDYVKPQYKNIGLIGFSLGAVISINVLSRTDKVKSFIAVSAPSEFKKINFQFWKLDFENDILNNIGEGRIGKGVRPGPFWLNKPKPIALINKIKIPILYVHGDKDWVVRYKHSQELHAKTGPGKAISIIAGGPHAEYLIRKNRLQTFVLIKEWFANTLS